ncbi:hypothetical protein ANN_19180, partial [Periplaneta americana]
LAEPPAWLSRLRRLPVGLKLRSGVGSIAAWADYLVEFFLRFFVSYDGTWMKREHTYLYGISIVIDVLTGLIIEYYILSRYCGVCAQQRKRIAIESEEFKLWRKNHKEEGKCDINFYESSNAMEVEAAKRIWQRSVDLCKMRYTSLLSDGDAKTYKSLQELSVYGEEVNNEKEECLNHVAKRSTQCGMEEGPKENFVSKKKLEIAVTSAVSEFNIECTASISLQDAVTGMKTSPAAYKTGHMRDRHRLQQGAASSKKTFKSSQRKLRLSKSVTEERTKKQEGPTYEPGGFKVFTEMRKIGRSRKRWNAEIITVMKNLELQDENLETDKNDV